MAKHPDVLVIGGGIIGLTSAYFLAQAGLSVEVLDRGDLGREASWAGAGIIPPGNPDRAATPIDKLRAIGSVRFPELAAELHERTGLECGYLRCGGVEFLSPEDTDILPVWNAEGIRHERLDDSALHRLEPRAKAVPGTVPYHLPDCAQVRNPWHLRALIAACRSAGVVLRPHTEVSALEAPVRDAESILTRQAVLIATGAWAKELLTGPNRVPPLVYPVRGQIVLFRPPTPVLTRVLMFGKRYLVPRADGRVLVGSTEEPEAGFEKANTPEAVRGLTEFAWSVVPELREATVEKTWAGLRPGSPDGMPFIGPVPGYSNVFAAVGHFRAGIQLSIGTAEMVRDLITDKLPAVPADAFRLDRTPDLTARPAFRS
ncbi:MAG TPA: FAD-dependent oxidoreductase [Fimbriiglobus sp.]|nr:FAD-dependent oxidoreductase [Fimbriiglobus sp.]